MSTELGSGIVSATVFAALTAGIIAPSAEAVPASKMRVKMAEYYVKTAEGSRGLSQTALKDARQKVDDLKKESADDPAVIALDERLQKVEGKAANDAAERDAAKKAQEERAAAEKKAWEDKIAAEKAQNDKAFAEKKAKAAAEAASVPAVAHAAALPWVMEKRDQRADEEAITKYIDGLGRVTDSKEVAGLKEALEARAAEDRKIAAAGGEAAFSAKQELDRYEHFLNQLGHQTLVGFFEGSVNLEQGFVDFKSLGVRTSNSTVYVKTSAEDGKQYFYESNGYRTFVDGADLDLVTDAQRRFFYVNYLLSGQKDITCRKNAAAAITMFNYLGQARENNRVENIDFAPMPKKGALHGEFAAEALAAAKKSLSYADAYEVIIDADDWTVERNALGIIQRRKFGAWALKKLAHGIRAFRAQWCQDYQGGDSYGKLRLHGVVGGNMYVK